MDVVQTKRWWSDYVANDYFTEFSFGFSRPDLIKRFKLGKGSVVLEIGFGYGLELSQFCKLSDHVFGVDLSNHAPVLARQKLKEQGIVNMPELVTYSGDSLPLADSTFDLIYSCFVVQHMSKHSAVVLHKEIKRILAPKGRALMEFFGCPDYYKPGLEEDVFSGIPGDKDSGPYGGMYNNAYTIKEIASIVLLTGLGVDWIDVQSIDRKTGFNNYWACFVKGS